MTSFGRADGFRRDREQGSIIWALLVSMLLLTLTMIFTASLISTVQRSKASTDTMMLTQYTDAATAAAIAALNADPATVAQSMAAAPVHCEGIAARAMCYRYWAMPVPGSATDPVRYDLVSRVWIDDGSMSEPANTSMVRSERLPLEVITYQTLGGQGPVVVDGAVPHIAYAATPSGLFANAIHSFTTTTIAGQSASAAGASTFKIRSYDSGTGLTGTGNAAVTSAGWISFGPSTQADRTVLYGGSGLAGDHTSRCTGEACVESGTRVVTATYAVPTDGSVAWMRDPLTNQCANHIAGDYVTSEHTNMLPVGITCIDGSLIVDSPTKTDGASPLTSIYVNGTISIQASLNAPLLGSLAAPASLVIYSTGGAVAFDTVNGAQVSALLYAPMAVCGNSPASTNATTFFGSLVCGSVSLSGNWDQQFDEAESASFVDPVRGMMKTFAPGVPTAVGFDQYLTPVGSTLSSCPIAAPAAASGYWKLDEGPGAIAAKDSSGSGLVGGWLNTTAAARTTGVCGNAAFSRSGGTVVRGANVTAPTGLTLEYWGKGLTSTTAVSMAGVKVTQDDLRHITVTVGAAAVRIPFSVENPASWHLFTIVVSASGDVALYVDGTGLAGAAKGSGTSGILPSSISGPLVIGDGNGAGAIDEVVYYNTPLTLTQVATRWAFWNAPHAGVAFSVSDPGTPFTAPTGVADNGTLPNAPLKIKWVPPTGTFPTGDATVRYDVQYADASTGPWTALGTQVATTNTWQQTNPVAGARFYRICAVYNGDTKCSAGVKIITLPIAAAPVVSVGAITTTTVAFTWTAPLYAATYESQYRLNGGPWLGGGGVAGAVIGEGGNSHTHGPTGPGTRIEVRVRSVNAAGTSAWSNVAGAFETMPTPVVTPGAFTNSTAAFSWTGNGNAARYEVRYRVNSAAWGSISSMATNTSNNFGPVVQGSLLGVQVRMVDPNGTAGAWGAASRQLGVDSPVVESYNFTSAGLNYYTSINTYGCPAGTVLKWSAQDQMTTWGTNWNGWAPWATTPVGAATTGQMNSYSAGAVNVSFSLVCGNDASGQSSPSVGWVIWGASHASSQNPNTGADSIGSWSPGSISAAGWTFDRDFPTAAIHVDLWVDGIYGYALGFAHSNRPDVAAAFSGWGVGSFHGLNTTIYGVPSGYRHVILTAIGTNDDHTVLWDGYLNVM